MIIIFISHAGRQRYSLSVLCYHFPSEFVFTFVHDCVLGKQFVCFCTISVNHISVCFHISLSVYSSSDDSTYCQEIILFPDSL